MQAVSVGAARNSRLRPHQPRMGSARSLAQDLGTEGGQSGSVLATSCLISILTHYSFQDLPILLFTLIYLRHPLDPFNSPNTYFLGFHLPGPTPPVRLSCFPTRLCFSLSLLLSKRSPR